MIVSRGLWSINHLLPLLFCSIKITHNIQLKSTNVSQKNIIKSKQSTKTKWSRYPPNLLISQILQKEINSPDILVSTLADNGLTKSHCGRSATFKEEEKIGQISTSRSRTSMVPYRYLCNLLQQEVRASVHRQAVEQRHLKFANLNS